MILRIASSRSGLLKLSVILTIRYGSIQRVAGHWYKTDRRGDMTWRKTMTIPAKRPSRGISAAGRGITNLEKVEVVGEDRGACYSEIIKLWYFNQRTSVTPVVHFTALITTSVSDRMTEERSRSVSEWLAINASWFYSRSIYRTQPASASDNSIGSLPACNQNIFYVRTPCRNCLRLGIGSAELS